MNIGLLCCVTFGRKRKNNISQHKESCSAWAGSTFLRYYFHITYYLIASYRNEYQCLMSEATFTSIGLTPQIYVRYTLFKLF